METRRPRSFIADFVEATQKQGRLTFTLSDLERSGISYDRNVEAALRRHASTGAILRASRKSRFFLIVPPEYRMIGTPPVDWWLGEYMDHLEMPYYVGLLSAAERHGSAHYGVMETQIVTERWMRPMAIGRNLLRFFGKSDMRQTPARPVMNPWGKVFVSTPEATMLDLVRYYIHSPSRVLEVISGLVANIDRKELRALLRRTSDTASIQRLGVILEALGQSALADIVAAALPDEKFLTPVDLVPDNGPGGSRSARWQVNINDPGALGQ